MTTMCCLEEVGARLPVSLLPLSYIETVVSCVLEVSAHSPLSLPSTRTFRRAADEHEPLPASHRLALLRLSGAGVVLR